MMFVITTGECFSFLGNDGFLLYYLLLEEQNRSDDSTD